MKKEYIAGLITVLLVLSSALVLYILVIRSASGQKESELGQTVRVLGVRVDALERQRDLLAGSAATLEEEAESLKKRVRHIDAEIQNMRQLLANAGNDVGAPAFSWRRMRVTTASGIVIIAFLVFIWLLYSGSRREEEASGRPLPAGEPETAEEEAVPGSVLEEEFPPAAGREPPESSPDEGEDAEGGARKEEKAS